MTKYAEVMERCVENCRVVVEMKDENVFASDGYGWYFVYHDGIAEKVNRSLLSKTVLDETAEIRMQLLKMAEPYEGSRLSNLPVDYTRVIKTGREFKAHARHTGVGGHGVDAYVLCSESRELIDESSTAVFVSRKLVYNAAVLAGRNPDGWQYWHWRLVNREIKDGIAAWIFGGRFASSVIMPLCIPWAVHP